MPAGPKSRQRADTKRAGAARLPARLLAALAQWPIESGACAVFAALLAGILLNALALQNARHASPLFGTPVTLVPAEAPRPVPRPVSVSAPSTATQSAPPVAIPARPIATPRDAEAAAAKPADGIGDMLRSGPASSPGAASTNPSAIEATRIVLVQKALMKLGYVVRPDGAMGTTTRQAIEKFERERGWPAHGELTPKVLREIAAKSGLSLE